MPSAATTRWPAAGIVAACAGLGLPPPPTVAPLTDDEVPPAPVERGVLEALAEPDAVVHVHVQERVGPLVHTVVVKKAELLVEQRSSLLPDVALRPWVGGAILDRVAALTGGASTRPGVGATVRMTGRAWLALLDGAGRADAATARLLRSEGAVGPAVDGLLAAAADWVRTVSVVAVRDAGRNRLLGTTTAWVDAGRGGLWSVVAPQLGPPGGDPVARDALLDLAEVVLAPGGWPAAAAEIHEGVTGEDALRGPRSVGTV